MRFTLHLYARPSSILVSCKKAFKKSAQKDIGTVFNYYYNMQVKKFGNTTLMRFNNSFKRYIRSEWDNLSATKKRLYYAMFFEQHNLSPSELTSYELARCLEIEKPAASEYLMFRNRFKSKFDRLWRQNSEVNMKLIFQSGSIANNYHEFSPGRAKRSIQHIDPNRDYILRFKEMCKECRRIWNTKVGEEEKKTIHEHWLNAQQEFKNTLDIEIEVIKLNLEKLANAKRVGKSQAVSDHGNAMTLLMMKTSNG